MLPSTQQQKSLEVTPPDDDSKSKDDSVVQDTEQKAFNIPFTQVDEIVSQQSLTENLVETQPFHADGADENDEEENQDLEDEKDKKEDKSEEEELAPTQRFSESSDDDPTYKVGDRVQVHYKNVMYLNAVIQKVIYCCRTYYEHTVFLQNETYFEHIMNGIMNIF